MCISVPQSNRSTSPRPTAASCVEEQPKDNSHHVKHQRKGSPRCAAANAEDRRNNRRYIIAKHDYHDHASDCAPSMGSTTSSADLMLPVVTMIRGGGGSGAATCPVAFPIKLYEMLENVEKDGYEHVVSWQPHGRCFVVHQSKVFQQVLLPRYFGGLSKMASFQRQLNLYGFMRLSRGPDKGGYYHELFLRKKPFLMHRIQRIKVKGTGVRARSNPDQEPDFWNMPWVGDATASSSTMSYLPVQQQQVKPPTQVHSEPMAFPSSSCSTVSVVSHDCPTEGVAMHQQHQQQQQEQVYQQPLPSTIHTSPAPVTAARSYSPPNQVLCRHYLPQPLPASSPCTQQQTVAHPGQQLFLNRAVEPLHCRQNNNNKARTSSASMAFSRVSSDDEESSDDHNLVVMTGWGKPFYFLGALPKPAAEATAATKEKTPTTCQQQPVVILSQQQQQQTLSSSSHRPLPPAPRMYISKLSSPPTPPPPQPPTTESTSVALEFDALDFFMDDVLKHNDDHEYHQHPQQQKPQHQGHYCNDLQDDCFAKMLERIIE